MCNVHTPSFQAYHEFIKEAVSSCNLPEKPPVYAELEYARKLLDDRRQWGPTTLECKQYSNVSESSGLGLAQGVTSHADAVLAWLRVSGLYTPLCQAGSTMPIECVLK